jgi:hypothetical protein
MVANFFHRKCSRRVATIAPIVFNPACANGHGAQSWRVGVRRRAHRLSGRKLWPSSPAYRFTHATVTPCRATQLTQRRQSTARRTVASATFRRVTCWYAPRPICSQQCKSEAPPSPLLSGTGAPHRAVVAVDSEPRVGEARMEAGLDGRLAVGLRQR